MDDNEELTPEKPKRKKVVKTAYRVLKGLSYNHKHVAVGEVVNDIPAGSIKWLLESGAIEKVED